MSDDPRGTEGGPAATHARSAPAATHARSAPVGTIRIVGIGMGPQHVTPEAAAALAASDYVIAARKSDADGLLAIRRAVVEPFGLEIVAVDDPPRDRDDPADYPAAVAAWHAARVAAYAAVLRARGGSAAFLVWGDPSLYDSSIRIVAALASELGVGYEVVPGISAPQLLAARHRIVLHPVGAPVHVTTGRRLPEAVASGQTNVVIMLLSRLPLDGLENWTIWWGANLGTPSEELVSGRVADVLRAIEAARTRAKDAAGWVMDLALLRAPEASS